MTASTLWSAALGGILVAVTMSIIEWLFRRTP